MAVDVVVVVVDVGVGGRDDKMITDDNSGDGRLNADGFQLVYFRSVRGRHLSWPSSGTLDGAAA